MIHYLILSVLSLSCIWIAFKVGKDERKTRKQW